MPADIRCAIESTKNTAMISLINYILLPNHLLSLDHNLNRFYTLVARVKTVLKSDSRNVSQGLLSCGK